MVLVTSDVNTAAMICTANRCFSIQRRMSRIPLTSPLCVSVDMTPHTLRDAFLSPLPVLYWQRKEVKELDKLSLRVLRLLSQNSGATEQETIVEQFGDDSLRSLTYLEAEGFVKSGRLPAGGGVVCSNGQFTITSKGLSFLEERPGKLYDTWSTRFFAIWGAITGTAALILEVMLHFL